jgi:serine/threonine-protein kinase
MKQVLSRRFAGLAGSLARKVDQACDRFESAWQAGERPRLEEYLGETAEQEREALLGELLFLELEYRFPRDRDRLLSWLGGTVPPPPPDEVPSTLDPAAQTFPTPPPGVGHAMAAVPGYEILGELGKGGMGVVYQARQVQLERIVALKMILHAEYAGPAERQRFQTEARAVARLQHPNIVQIHEVGVYKGQPYFSLEYCAGGSLADKLDGTPWKANEAAELVQTLARAVHAAHLANVVHRDLKPANVLLTPDGTPKISDFGLAKKLDEKSQTQTGAVLGTPSYMAPEQAGAKREVGPAADVYALGAILYELLTGRPPFKAATAMDTVLLVLSEDPVAIRRLQPKVSKDLETICHKCLEKDPAKRYASAEALAEDLRCFQSGEAIQARPLGVVARGWRWCRRNRGTAGLLTGLAASLLLGTVLTSYLVFAVRAGATSEREKAIARRVVRWLMENSKRAEQPEAVVIDQFLQDHPRISRQDLDKAFHESGWKPTQAPGTSARPVVIERERPGGTKYQQKGWEVTLPDGRKLVLSMPRVDNEDANALPPDFGAVEPEAGVAAPGTAISAATPFFGD